MTKLAKAWSPGRHSAEGEASDPGNDPKCRTPTYDQQKAQEIDLFGVAQGQIQFNPHPCETTCFQNRTKLTGHC